MFFEAVVVAMAIICLCYVWACVTVPLGNRVLQPMLVQVGWGEWYLSPYHKLFWKTTMVFPVIMGLVLLLNIVTALSSFPWLFPVAIAVLVLYVLPAVWFQCLTETKFYEAILIWPYVLFVNAWGQSA